MKVPLNRLSTIAQGQTGKGNGSQKVIQNEVVQMHIMYVLYLPSFFLMVKFGLLAISGRRLYRK